MSVSLSTKPFSPRRELPVVGDGGGVGKGLGKNENGSISVFNSLWLGLCRKRFTNGYRFLKKGNQLYPLFQGAFLSSVERALEWTCFGYKFFSYFVIMDALSPVLLKLGISQLKHHQQLILEALTNREDVVVVLPTGYGKSLSFQVAPFLRSPQRRPQEECRGIGKLLN